MRQEMTDSDYKKYTSQAKAAIKGEAFFEALISDYSIPHHVMGLKDVGIDYICEWVYGEKPTGFLYAVQVKTLSFRNVRPIPDGTDHDRSELERFKIKNKYLHVGEKTLQYWRGFGMPVYLFAIIYSEPSGRGEQLDCYYKRFTPVLTTTKTQEEEHFNKVNDGTTFIAFADKENKSFGFARDLFIDLMRCSYYKGSISYISPITLGLKQFPEGDDTVFEELFEEYRKNVTRAIDLTNKMLKRINNGQAIPSTKAPEAE
jgi:hypothetical protein